MTFLKKSVSPLLLFPFAVGLSFHLVVRILEEFLSSRVKFMKETLTEMKLYLIHMDNRNLTCASIVLFSLSG